MTDNKAPVWFVTGCSTGFGRDLAQVLIEQGKRVVVTARQIEKIKHLSQDKEGQVLALKLDVTDHLQAENAIKEALRAFGQIDVLVNNAGYGYLAAIEESDEKQVRDMFDTNFFGAARMMHIVLPFMRQQRSGVIVNMSSLGGLVAFPGLGYYNATKFALEGLSEALAKEVEPLGIKVLLVEPSGFRTDWAGRSILESLHPIADYDKTAGQMKKNIKGVSGHQAGDPLLAVKAIIEAVQSKQMPHHLLLGKEALRGALDKLEKLKVDFEAWRSVTLGVDSPKNKKVD